MDFKIIEKIKKELDKSDIVAYDLHITFSDKTNVSFNKAAVQEKNIIGFK